MKTTQKKNAIVLKLKPNTSLLQTSTNNYVDPQTLYHRDLRVHYSKHKSKIEKGLIHYDSSDWKNVKVNINDSFTKEKEKNDVEGNSNSLSTIPARSRNTGADAPPMEVISASNCHFMLWSTDIAIGDSPQEFSVALDTGTPTLWVPSARCDDTCKDLSWLNYYHQKDSKTYKPFSKDRNEIKFYGLHIRGEYAVDDVRIGHTLSQEFIFAQVTMTTNALDLCENIDGVLGLNLHNARNPKIRPSIYGLLSDVEFPVFSLYMDPFDDFKLKKSDKDNKNEDIGGASEMILGGVDQNHYDGCLHWYPIGSLPEPEDTDGDGDGDGDGGDDKEHGDDKDDDDKKDGDDKTDDDDKEHGDDDKEHGDDDKEHGDDEKDGDAKKHGDDEKDGDHKKGGDRTLKDKPSSEYWDFPVEDVVIGSKSVTSKPSIAILDSSSTNIVGPREIVGLFAKKNNMDCFLIDDDNENNDVELSVVDCDDGNFDVMMVECDPKKKTDDFRPLRFIADDIPYEFDIYELSDIIPNEKSGGFICQPHLIGSDIIQTWVMGSPFMMKYYSAYSVDQRAIGLAPASKSNGKICEADLPITVNVGSIDEDKPPKDDKELPEEDDDDDSPNEDDKQSKNDDNPSNYYKPVVDDLPLDDHILTDDRYQPEETDSGEMLDDKQLDSLTNQMDSYPDDPAGANSFSGIAMFSLVALVLLFFIVRRRKKAAAERSNFAQVELGSMTDHDYDMEMDVDLFRIGEDLELS